MKNNDSFVAINLWVDNENRSDEERTIDDSKILINNVPILFYWNGEGVLLDSLKNDEKFKAYIQQRCMNSSVYHRSHISFFFFEYNDGQEEYKKQDKIAIESMYPLETLDDKFNFYLNYVSKIFHKLYNKSFSEPYSSGNEDISTENVIKDIWNKLHEKYKERLGLETTLQYVRSKLDAYNLRQENIEFIINRLHTLLS